MPANGKRYQALSPRELAFCRHYVVCSVGSEAAREAGYSPNGATSQACRLLKRELIQAEISRLREAARNAVSGLLVPALAGENTDAGASMPLELRQSTDRDVVALVDRNYAIAGLVQGMEMALGRRKTTISRVTQRKDGRARVTECAITKIDVPAAARCAELLLRYLGDPKPLPGQKDKVSPEIVAVLDGFRAVVTRYKARIANDKPEDGSDGTG
jgi:phage terminase small subunit